MYIQLHTNKTVKGVKFSFDSFACYRAKPIPIMITLGYDPTNHPISEYLYIEMQLEDDMDYASPEEIDGCLYNSLADSELFAPFLLRYLQIFIKYKIFIPIEMYQILRDTRYCDPYSKIGYVSMGSISELDDLSIRANNIFGSNPEKYYIHFENFLRGREYQHPLSDKISAYGINPPPKEAELDYAADDEVEEEDIAEQDHDCKTYDVDTRFEQSQYPARKSILTLGEGDFSYAEALCRKHPQIVPKIIATEYRSRDEIESEYDTHQLAIVTTIKKQYIEKLAKKTVVLLGEKNQYKAYLVLNGKLIKPTKQSPPYELLINLSDSENITLRPDQTTKIVPRTLENTDVMDKIFTDIHNAFSQPPYVKSFTSHAFYLENTGVQMLYGIDAQKIDVLFRRYKFGAIHFNCPHIPGHSKTRALPNMLYNFFKSAALLQSIGDKIYMALPYPIDIEERSKRTSYIYKVYDAAAAYGYKVIKKRKFDAVRYPGYVHRMTEKASSAKVAEQIREYIFRRIEPLIELPQSVHYKSPAETKKHYTGTQFEETGHILPEPDTDSDSSVYNSDEHEEVMSSGNSSMVVCAASAAVPVHQINIADTKASKQPESFFYHPHQMIDRRLVLGCDAPPGSIIENGLTIVPNR